MRENLSEELRASIIAIAGERSPVDTRESWLRRGARKAGIPYSAAKKFFYREAVNPRASLVDRVREAVAQKNLERDSAFATEHDKLQQRVAHIEQRLSALCSQPDSVSVYRFGEDVYIIGRGRSPLD